MAVILFDTNIILYYLGGRLIQDLPAGEYCVSIISEIELLSYPKLDKKSETQITNFLSELSVVELKSEIKDVAIALRRKFSLKVPDAIIAATALTMNANLITNDKQFMKLPKIKCQQLAIK